MKCSKDHENDETDNTSSKAEDICVSHRCAVRSDISNISWRCANCGNPFLWLLMGREVWGGEDYTSDWQSNWVRRRNLCTYNWARDQFAASRNQPYRWTHLLCPGWTTWWTTRRDRCRLFRETFPSEIEDEEGWKLWRRVENLSMMDYWMEHCLTSTTIWYSCTLVLMRDVSIAKASS